MRTYALHDECNEAAGVLAYLECYEDERSCYFELPPAVDPWDLPFILHEFAQRNERTIDAHWSMAWVRSRIVPPERQNLGEVMRENGLDEYDELRLLELTGGRCSQDGCYLVPTSRAQLPAWYGERITNRLLDVCPLDGFCLLLVSRGGCISLCDMAAGLADRRRFARVLGDPQVFARVALQPGGHGVRWGEELLLSVEDLADMGVNMPLKAKDASSVVGQLLCDTSEAASLLGCTRQNVSDLVRRGRLAPVKMGKHMALFLRCDLLAYKLGLGG